MEFNEKLKALRSSRGLTQEELAEALFVSRTAISKWESGRGYPSIDSLKEISSFFSVTIDELLSGEKLLSIAEKENKSNMQNLCSILIGAIDLFHFLLIVLPLYPKSMKVVIAFSMPLGIAAVLFLALTGETYATALAFLLLVLKAGLYMKGR